MLGRGGTFVHRVYLNYNGVFGKNIAAIIVHCIIEKRYTETPDRPNIKSCYLSILSLFNKKNSWRQKIKNQGDFFH